MSLARMYFETFVTCVRSASEAEQCKAVVALQAFRRALTDAEERELFVAWDALRRSGDSKQLTETCNKIRVRLFNEEALTRAANAM